MEHIENQPVEISAYFSEGEWSEASVQELFAKYRRDFTEMGADPDEVTTEAVPVEDGGLNVRAVWTRRRPRSFEDFGAPTSSNHAAAGTLGESRPEGLTTEGSRGLGAVYGEADRTPEV